MEYDYAKMDDERQLDPMKLGNYEFEIQNPGLGNLLICDTAKLLRSLAFVVIFSPNYLK